MADESKQPVVANDTGKPTSDTKPPAPPPQDGRPANSAKNPAANPQSYEERAQGLTGPTGMTGENGDPPHKGTLSVEKQGDKLVISLNPKDPIAVNVIRKAVGQLVGAGRKDEADKLSAHLEPNSF